MYTTRNGEGSPSLSEKYFRAKYTAKWSVQIAGMLFQTRSSPRHTASKAVGPLVMVDPLR